MFINVNKHYNTSTGNETNCMSLVKPRLKSRYVNYSKHIFDWLAYYMKCRSDGYNDSLHKHSKNHLTTLYTKQPWSADTSK